MSLLSYARRRSIGQNCLTHGSVMNAIADAVGEEIFRKAPVTADIVLLSLEHGKRMHDPLASHI